MQHNKKRLMRILGGGAIYAASFFEFDNDILNIAMFLLGYFIIGGDIVLKAVKNILRGQVFDETLMFIATNWFCYRRLWRSRRSYAILSGG